MSKDTENDFLIQSEVTQPLISAENQPKPTQYVDNDNEIPKDNQFNLSDKSDDDLIDDEQMENVFAQDEGEAFYEWVFVFAEQDSNETGFCKKKVSEEKLFKVQEKKGKIKGWITDAGLSIRESSSSENTFSYMEIGATNKTLEEWAEKSKLRIQILGPTEEDNLGYAEFISSKKGLYKRATEECMFTSSERQKIIRTIIETRKKDGGCGLNPTKLIKRKYVTDIFALHNYSELDPLINRWSKSCRPSQPLDKVRDYFGENVAFYFTYLGFYTKWLILLSIISIPFGIIQLKQHTPAPPSALFYSFILAIWITVFIEFWKRKSYTKALHWDTLFYEREEQIRPEFRGKMVVSEITGEEEPYYPGWKRKFKYIITYSVVCVFIAIAIVASVEINRKRLLENERHLPTNEMIGYSIATGVCIFVLNYLFQKVAPLLNDWENHRTDTDYENALIVKFFLFQFINSFTALFCIAFIAKDPTYLSAQLSSILIFRQAIGNVQEVLIPWIRGKLKIRKQKKKLRALQEMGLDMIQISPIETQSKFPRYDYTIDDYSEMMIQLGYVSLFSTVFPVSAILALLNNVIEIRSDSYKLRAMKRPEPRPANGIGTWLTILEIMAFLIIISNTAFVAIASKDQLDPYFDSSISDAQELWFLVAAEHILVFIKISLRYIIPDVPQEVEDAFQKDIYENRLASPVTKTQFFDRSLLDESTQEK
ncbi:ngep-related [Anaeramoeba ignava]|uniref:Ngep-related n=1 Tax=Anaeramoeba ignava TaxID=1746090 RepID=A0A9Q0LGN8_ANAIG|nr:ngep-related [Anaeramoeba ignava]